VRKVALIPDARGYDPRGLRTAWWEEKLACRDFFFWIPSFFKKMVWFLFCELKMVCFFNLKWSVFGVMWCYVLVCLIIDLV
jgi:hypothetical protein